MPSAAARRFEGADYLCPSPAGAQGSSAGALQGRCLLRPIAPATSPRACRSPWKGQRLSTVSDTRAEHPPLANAGATHRPSHGYSLQRQVSRTRLETFTSVKNTNPAVQSQIPGRLLRVSTRQCTPRVWLRADLNHVLTSENTSGRRLTTASREQSHDPSGTRESVRGCTPGPRPRHLTSGSVRHVDLDQGDRRHEEGDRWT
jgi:hypothetical protein